MGSTVSSISCQARPSTVSRSVPSRTGMRTLPKAHRAFGYFLPRVANSRIANLTIRTSDPTGLATPLSAIYAQNRATPRGILDCRAGKRKVGSALREKPDWEGRRGQGELGELGELS